MHQIADFWWFWSILAAVTLIYGGYNQVSRMKNVMAGGADFTKGLFPLFVAAILHFVFLILTIAALVLNIIDYSKGNV